MRQKPAESDKKWTTVYLAVVHFHLSYYLKVESLRIRSSPQLAGFTAIKWPLAAENHWIRGDIADVATFSPFNGYTSFSRE